MASHDGEFWMDGRDEDDVHRRSGEDDDGQTSTFKFLVSLIKPGDMCAFGGSAVVASGKERELVHPIVSAESFNTDTVDV